MARKSPRASDEVVVRSLRSRDERHTGSQAAWWVSHVRRAAPSPLAPQQKAASVSPQQQNLSNQFFQAPDLSFLRPWDSYMTDFSVGIEQWDLRMQEASFREQSWNGDMLQPQLDAMRIPSSTPSWNGQSSNSQPCPSNEMGMNSTCQF